MINFWREGLLLDKPRWMVLLVDMLIVSTGFVISYILIFKHRGILELDNLFVQLLVVSTIYLFWFLIFGTYKSVMHKTGIRDLQHLVFAVILSYLSAELLCKFIEWNASVSSMLDNILPFSDTQLLFHALIAGFGMTFLRVLYRSIYHELVWNQKDNRIPVILFGAGNMGNTTFHFIHTTSRNKYRIVAILDDKPSRIGKRIQGFKVRDINCLNKAFVQKHGNAHELIIAIDDHNPARLEQVFKLAEPIPLIVKIIPDTAKLLAGEVATRQIRSLRIEDLLGRKAIDLDNPTIASEMKDQIVLVTGGAGSIGSELVRQLAHTDIRKLVVLDQAESALYEIQQELSSNVNFDRFTFIVGNIRNRPFMETVFQRFLPSYVFHAAAYKHVPLMEANPYESILTNVCGSYALAKLADKYNVAKFVMVSTDKAVNPTNVMGATKRVAEIAVSTVNKYSKTNFIVTRFGNVLGSNGSVIPLFERQMLHGGPLTITDPNITRYFMTIPEACQLVQEAAVMGKGGEIFVFDMGEPIKIMELAKQMIRLKGYNYPEDIDIKVVGLRPGEKIFEELLANGENTEKTYHEKIMIAKVNTADLDHQKSRVEYLCQYVQNANPNTENMELVRLIKEIVPEYRSQNSVFQTLDK
ncbi:nucleoside-diphosphate sugar epimerase/dehydratase [uncultured Sphingobacterium sp.]|uniref:polysaccharide biosynthesis protein n=1 Tax=uncultured Sphingobacterium sp. TaxID=182688 RepID=UPI0025D25733|nr:nucleoside-diphosphate sugar epimerase/dehydratase [uncultured Sphingobacterium sp.]